MQINLYNKKRNQLISKALLYLGWILFFICLCSCASVKKSSEETEIKVEDKTETVTDLTRFSSSFTLEPINLDKPILIGKDTIYNTRVIYNNSKETIKEVEKKDFKADLKQEVKTKDKDYSQTIETLANRLLLLILILFVINIVAKKINPLK
jgi:hypothetical protein